MIFLKRFKGSIDRFWQLSNFCSKIYLPALNAGFGRIGLRFGLIIIYVLR